MGTLVFLVFLDNNYIQNRAASYAYVSIYTLIVSLDSFIHDQTYHTGTKTFPLRSRLHPPVFSSILLPLSVPSLRFLPLCVHSKLLLELVCLLILIKTRNVIPCFSHSIYAIIVVDIHYRLSPYFVFDDKSISTFSDIEIAHLLPLFLLCAPPWPYPYRPPWMPPLSTI